MKVTRSFVLRFLCAMSLALSVSCASDQEQMEEGVQTEEEPMEESLVGEEDMSDDDLAMSDDPGDSFVSEEDETSADAYASSDVMDEIAQDTEMASGDETFEETTYDDLGDSQSMVYQEPAVEEPVSTPAYSASIANNGFAGNEMAAPGTAKHTYVVQNGDSLSQIARRIYGSSSKWAHLAQLNGLSNPNKIYPGDTLFYSSNSDSEDFAAAFDSVPKQSINVKKGDTLSSIAAKVLGSSSRWKVLWGYNWQKIKNPNFITVGQKLWYIKSGDMSNFLAAVDGDQTQKQAPVAAAKPKPTPVAEPEPVQVVEEPEEIQQVSEEVVEEVVEEEVPVEEVVVEEEVAVEEEPVLEDDIIEDIEVDSMDEEALDEELEFEEIEE